MKPHVPLFPSFLRESFPHTAQIDYLWGVAYGIILARGCNLLQWIPTTRYSCVPLIAVIFTRILQSGLLMRLLQISAWELKLNDCHFAGLHLSRLTPLPTKTSSLTHSFSPQLAVLARGTQVRV